jgi:hypothetical protein
MSTLHAGGGRRRRSGNDDAAVPLTHQEDGNMQIEQPKQIETGRL